MYSSCTRSDGDTLGRNRLQFPLPSRKVWMYCHCGSNHHIVPEYVYVHFFIAFIYWRSIVVLENRCLGCRCQDYLSDACDPFTSTSKSFNDDSWRWWRRARTKTTRCADWWRSQESLGPLFWRRQQVSTDQIKLMVFILCEGVHALKIRP